MTICHIKAYEMIHHMRKEMGYHDTKVSFAHHVRVFKARNPHNPWHSVCANLLEYFFQGALTKAMFTGQMSWPLKKSKAVKPGEYCDFIGVNYYTRSEVSKYADGIKEDAPKNDLGWEIYPKGIIECVFCIH